MEDTRIEFTIRQPRNVVESEINTLILAANYLYGMYEMPMTCEDREYYHKYLDLIRTSVDNLEKLTCY